MMARRNFNGASGGQWEVEAGHYFPGQGVVPAGTYQDMETSRLVHLEFPDTLPASMDGRVACYRRLTESEARAAVFRRAPDNVPQDDLPESPAESAATGVTAGTIMTVPVLMVRDTMTLREVSAFLDEHGISGAPVVDSEGRLVGVVSEKDLLEHAHAHVSLPRVLTRTTALYGGLGDAPETMLREAYALGLSARASEVMTYPVIAAEENDSAAHLADLMLTHRLNRIPILRDGKPVGIVTREGVLRAIRALAGMGTGN